MVDHNAQTTPNEQSAREKESKGEAADFLEPKAFVAGATGYVGNAVVQHLVARGIETIAHVRPESRMYHQATRHFEELGAKVSHAPWDGYELTKMLQNEWPTLIFSCLGTTKARRRAAPNSRKSKETYRSVDYGLTKLLIDAAVDSCTDPKFVYLSAMGASRRARTEYMFVRGELEQYLQHCGLSFSVARPGLITGQDRVESRPLELVAGAIGDSLLTAAGAIGFKKLRNKYRSFTAFELADALVEIGLDRRYDREFVEADQLHKIAKI